MMELTKARQGEYELIVDFINRRRNMSLNCKDRLGEISSIQMCIQAMNWDIHYMLQGLKPNTIK